MNYSGKICDGCREPLENGDDIVVCPVCGTPQHRSCYEKNHKCVNEYLHSTGFVWTDPDEGKQRTEAEQAAREEQSQPDQRPFVQATPQSMESVFMRGVLYDPKDDIGGATVGEAADYIQNSAPRYISKFMKQKKKNGKISWNWAAFFFAPYWFFYRKLYKAGAVFLALSVALTLVTSSRVEKILPTYEKWLSVSSKLYDINGNTEKTSTEKEQTREDLRAESMKLIKEMLPTLLAVLTVRRCIPNIIAALIANYLFKKKMLKVISLAHDASTEPNTVKYTIMRNGGVAIIMPIIAIMVDNYLPSLLLNIAYKINF